MKYYCMLTLLVTAGTLNAQWLENTIFVPDSFCGLQNPQALEHNTINNMVYCANGAGDNIRVETQLENF